jgi:hypothetical protein
MLMRTAVVIVIALQYPAVIDLYIANIVDMMIAHKVKVVLAFLLCEAGCRILV